MLADRSRAVLRGAAAGCWGYISTCFTGMRMVVSQQRNSPKAESCDTESQWTPVGKASV